MLSIIIPTLNEEKYLPLLLDSLKRQNFSDAEIIVADAGSTDATVEIAKRFNAIVVPGGLPAKGRNEGLKVAKGELVLFVDADVILPDTFLQHTLEEFKRRSLDIASFYLVPLPTTKFSVFAINAFYNYPIYFLETLLPHAAVGILGRRDLFEKLGGFDEEITLAEDHFLAREAQKKFRSKIGLIRSTKVFVSDRRFRKDGWLNIGIKYFLCELHLIFLGPVKTDIFKYKFNHYNEKKK